MTMTGDEEGLKLLEIDRQADADLYAIYQQSLYDVAKGSVDRSRAAADVVQKAAAAVGTIYAAALGVSFSSTDQALPARGLVPAVFLGIAVTSSTVYLAFVTRGRADTEEPSSAITRPGAQIRFQFFLRWTNAIVGRRLGWLRAAVVALGVGVATLPAPFVQFGEGDAATGSTIDWPEQPSGGDTALDAVLYEAQVAEVAAARQEAARPAGDEDLGLWLVLGGVGVVVVLVAAWLGDGRDTSAPAGGGTG